MTVKTPSRELNVLIRTAESQGWEIRVRTNNHLKWIAPSGFVYYSASTPSDHRAIKNILAALRRAGLSDSPKK